MNHWARNGPALRECNGCLACDSGVLGRPVYDEHHRLIRLVDDFDGPANCIEIVRRRPGWNQDEIRKTNYGPYQSRGLRRGINDHELKAALAGLCEVLGEGIKVARKEYWCFSLAPVPPPCQASLRVGIDEDHWPLPCPLGLHCKVPRQRCLACSALLRS